jgi:hypothetical protein
MVIYITAPPNNKQPKKIIRRLHPLASRPPPASSPHVAPALFVWSSVCLFLWLVVASSLCPLLSRPVQSRRRATSFRYVSSLVDRLVVVAESSRCRVLSCLVDVTHLVSPALFDCCVIVLHLVVTIQPQPPLSSPCPRRRRRHRRGVPCCCRSSPTAVLLDVVVVVVVVIIIIIPHTS